MYKILIVHDHKAETIFLKKALGKDFVISHEENRDAALGIVREQSIDFVLLRADAASLEMGQKRKEKTVGHDLNNHLTVIRGCFDLLLSSTGNDAKKYIDMGNGAIDRIQEILNASSS